MHKIKEAQPKLHHCEYSLDYIIKQSLRLRCIIKKGISKVALLALPSTYMYIFYL